MQIGKHDQKKNPVKTTSSNKLKYTFPSLYLSEHRSKQSEGKVLRGNKQNQMPRQWQILISPGLANNCLKMWQNVRHKFRFTSMNSERSHTSW